MNGRKLAAFALSGVMAVGLTACGGNGEPNESPAGGSGGEAYLVGICQLAPHDALDAATRGFKAALVEAFGEDGVKFDEQNAGGEYNNCATIVDGFVSENVDLMLANATYSLQAAQSATADIPLQPQKAPLNRVEEQRRALASRCSHTESEVTAMTTKPRRPIRILVAAAAVAAALTAGALAASGALGSISLLSGGAFTSTDSVNWNEPDAGATVAPSQENVCFPVREEPDLLTVRGGSVYFTTETGEELDITGQFSEAEPYVYSYTASDGSAHDIVIGGSLEDYGYMEYVYDAGGSFVGSAGILPTGYDSANSPPWLTAYEEARGLSF